jgi:hypothetical protein
VGQRLADCCFTTASGASTIRRSPSLDGVGRCLDPPTSYRVPCLTCIQRQLQLADLCLISLPIRSCADLSSSIASDDAQRLLDMQRLVQCLYKNLGKLTEAIDRKVSCDRGTPKCLKCIKSKRDCGGYGMRLTWPKQDCNRAAVGHTPLKHDQVVFCETGHQWINVLPTDIRLHFVKCTSIGNGEFYHIAIFPP